MPSWKNPQTNSLITALLALKNKAEAECFLRDLLTAEELIEFGKRWQAAQMLYIKTPYTKIIKNTGLSSTTVARIAKWLWSGKNGYKLILNRLHHHRLLPQEKSGGF